MVCRDKQVLVLNDISGSGHQVEIFAISSRSKPIKSKRSLNISDENGDPIELLAARFGQSEADVEIVYRLAGRVLWETVEVSKHVDIERTGAHGGRVARKDSEMNGTHATARVTGESAVKKRRLESINETEMSMAERLGTLRTP